MHCLSRLRQLTPGFACLMALASTASARADHVDRVLAGNAGKIFDEVAKLKAKNVAVLKFQTQIGDAKPRFGTASAGVEMVNRLENLLTLMQNPRDPRFTVLTRAGEAATALAKESKTSIDWTTPEGRKSLFALKLPVLWDDKDLRQPDAFVTGTLIVAKDFRSVTIKLCAFTKAAPEQLFDSGTGAGGKLEKPLLPPVYMDRAMLASHGLTFSTSRGLKATGKSRDWFVQDETASKSVADRVNQDGAKSVPSAASRIELQILLDGKPVAIQPDDGSMGEPVFGMISTKEAAGQKMRFTLKNHHSERLAVLLCVNGANTIAIDGETLDDPDKPRGRFRTFVLEPGVQYGIPGALVKAGDGERSSWQELEVLPAALGAQLFEQLNPQTRGKLQMYVFGPQVVPFPSITPGEDEIEPNPLGNNPQVQFDNALSSNGLSSRERKLGQARGLTAAQEALTKRTGLTPDGGILRGTARGQGLVGLSPTPPKDGEPVRIVRFPYDEQPLESIVIGYYKK